MNRVRVIVNGQATNDASICVETAGSVSIPSPGSSMEHEELTRCIIGCAMKVHDALGPGFLETVYLRALAHELRKSGLRLDCEARLQVRYDGVVVGEFVADLLVDGCIIVENKAVRTLLPLHEVQLVNYLTATAIDTGLLLNFGAARLEFKRKSRVYRASNTERLSTG